MKTHKIQIMLIEWFSLKGREFPWRKKNITAFEIVISEILLQRTRAENVEKIYEKFIKNYRSWNYIANCNINSLKNDLSAIGLQKQKADRLKILSHEMVNRNGVFPSNYNELIELPLIGEYIANAILLLAFNKPVPLIDINMVRFIERVYKKRDKVDYRYDPFIIKMGTQLVDCSNPKEMNWAILDLGALICKARNPLCENCPINNLCNYHLKNII